MGREERRKGELSPFEGWIFRVGKEIIGKSLPYRHVRMTNNWNGSRRGSTSVPAAPLEIRFNEDLRVFFFFLSLLERIIPLLSKEIDISSEIEFRNSQIKNSIASRRNRSI